jgi:hypothetical protein
LIASDEGYSVEEPSLAGILEDHSIFHGAWIISSDVSKLIHLLLI